MWIHLPEPKWDYKNPEHWGMCRLIDDLLRRQETEAIRNGTH